MKIKFYQKWWKFIENEITSGPKEPLKQKNLAMLRQAKTASLIIQAYLQGRPGLILADDVGLGKTWVGIIAAIAFASAPYKVVISAPNIMVRNKWADEIEQWYGDKPHQALWGKDKEGNWQCRHPGEAIDWVRYGDDGWNLKDRKIMLVTHRQFNERSTPWDCELLIVDEAHRRRNNESFKAKSKAANFTLFLTATPFGKKIELLTNMLKAVKCQDEEVIKAVKGYAVATKNYYSQNNGSKEEVRQTLDACRKHLRPWVIRHSLDNLSEEKEMIGRVGHILGNFSDDIEIASDNEIILREPVEPDEKTARLILHAQRLKDLKVFDDLEDAEYKSAATLMAPISTHALKDLLCKRKQQDSQEELPEISYHWEGLGKALDDAAEPMQAALKAFAMNCFKNHEKFIVFCYHTKTADEVLDILEEAWKQANITEKSLDQQYIDQILSKISNRRGDKESIAILKEKARLFKFGGEDPAEEDVSETFDILWDHVQVLKKMDEDDNNTYGLRAVPKIHGAENIIRILFNSPFFPQALILTSQHSEGIDLHKRCRILVHYELNYRIENLLQANGRIRRLGSWAAKSGKPILYYYPYLKGTRDEQLTRVVLNRAKAFSKLMGGIPDLPIDKIFTREVSDIDVQHPEFILDNNRFKETLL